MRCGKAQLAVRAGADAEVVAELPVVEVVRAAVARRAHRPRPRSARRPARAGALGDAVEHGVGRVVRRAPPAGTWRSRCWARWSGGRPTGAAAPAPAPASRSASSACQRLARQRVHQVEVEGVEGASRASSTAAMACARSCMRPSAFRCSSSKLCTPTDRRLTPARAEGAEAVALEGAGVGLQRDLAVGRELQPRAQVAEQAVDRRAARTGWACRRR